jgi:hypothetical protein
VGLVELDHTLRVTPAFLSRMRNRTIGPNGLADSQFNQTSD